MEAASQAGAKAKAKVIIVLRTDGARTQNGKDQKSKGRGGWVPSWRCGMKGSNEDGMHGVLIWWWQGFVSVSPQQREVGTQSDCLVITHVPDLCSLGLLVQ